MVESATDTVSDHRLPFLGARRNIFSFSIHHVMDLVLFENWQAQVEVKATESRFIALWLLLPNEPANFIYF